MTIRRAIAAVAAVAALGMLAAARGSDDRAPRELLPDLDQAAPQSVAVVRGRSGDRVRFRLVFGSAVDNVGGGPLLVRGRRESRGNAAMRVTQLVRRDDGSIRSYPTHGEMRYVRAETHAHWHLLAFETYELRDARTGRLAASDRKTGFCLGDRYRTDPARRLAREPAAAVFTGECGRHRSDLLRVGGGLSVGYGDEYVPTLEGQYVDVTRAPAGRYVLVHRVNARRTLRESHYANNAASLLLDLERNGSVPHVRVLRRCPDSPTCR